MAEETATVSAAAEEKIEDVSAPSTSAEQADGDDVDAKAKSLMGEGHRHLVMKDIRSAVNAFQEASSLLGKKYGETADQCADAFYYYGVSLLEISRMENNVLGHALDGVPEEEDEESEEDPNIPSASNLDEEGAESDENEETEEKENDEEEEVGNLQLAWEMLDLAKIIFKRQQSKEAQLKAAQAHLKLGEVSIESENYTQAVEDFLACLGIQKEHLEEHDRLLAETHYQLGLAYHYSSKHDDAISHFTQSINVIEKRMAVLTEKLEKAAEESKEETQKEMDELKGLLPDIKEKIEDSKEAQKTAEDTNKALKETLGGTSGFPQENGNTSTSTATEKSGDSTVPVTNCVSDISHLVRKKRKPEEESPLKEAKKSKSEPVENGSGNGDAVVPTNDQVEKNEAENETPMETATVESTA